LASSPGLCATEKGWKSFPEQSPTKISILALKSMENANRNQGSIGIVNRRKAPVLMSTKSAKKVSWRPQTHFKEESIQLTKMGMNP
jgi:hypothetical protein